METRPANGMLSRTSPFSVEHTAARITVALTAKGITIFAVVDHSGEAQKAGLSMPETKLLIFGNPAAGTPLMLSSPSTAIDLPLKILVAADQAGQVSVSWNDSEYLRKRHGFSSDLVKNISVVDKLVTVALS